jgi:hypothetical protein
MILHHFRDLPDFPFPRYFADPAQFLHARHYWLALLHDTKGFVAAQWQPTPRPENLADDMYVGRVLDLTAPSLAKVMSIQTFSLEGDINMALRENGPMDPTHVPDLLDPAQRAAIIAGTPADKLHRDTIAHHVPMLVWVEKATVWRAVPGHAEGGTEIPVERLILTATISEDCEAQARRALELFLADGAAAERINSAFPG